MPPTWPVRAHSFDCNPRHAAPGSSSTTSTPQSPHTHPPFQWSSMDFCCSPSSIYSASPNPPPFSRATSTTIPLPFVRPNATAVCIGGPCPLSSNDRQATIANTGLQLPLPISPAPNSSTTSDNSSAISAPPPSHGTHCVVAAPMLSCSSAFHPNDFCIWVAGAATMPPAATLKSINASHLCPPRLSSSTQTAPPLHCLPPNYGRDHCCIRALHTLPLLLPLRQQQHRWCMAQFCRLLSRIPSQHPIAQIPSPFATEISRHLQTPLDLMEDTISMAHRLRRPPTPASLHNGIGPCGNAIVPFAIWSEFGLPHVLPLHPPSTVPPSTDAKLVLRTLQRSALVFETYPQPAAPCFTTYKSETKLRVIMDFRSYNLLFVDPPHFRLPHFDMILSARGSPDLFFVKIDIANFYWSLLLPAPVVGYFTVSSGVVGDATYGTRRMPFGWKWSPIIAQTTLARILRPLSEWFPAHLWQYIDDILMACCDPYFLQYALLFAKHLISQAGLFVSSKSSEFPVLTITWLGKTVSGTTVTNLPSSLATALAHIWLLRCSLLTRRRLLRVLGYLQWLLCSNANCAPFLAESYFLCSVLVL